MTMIYPRESAKVHPAYDFGGYRSTAKRAPKQPLIILPHTLSELTGPVYGHDSVRPEDADLTRQHAGEPLGERIIVHCQISTRVSGTGRASSSSTWPCTMMRSPSGSPACCRVRSASSGRTLSWP